MGSTAIAHALQPGAASLEAADGGADAGSSTAASWQTHYPGHAEAEQRVLRHYSYSDRIRYYWPAPAGHAGGGCADRRLRDGIRIPETLISQHLPRPLRPGGDGPAREPIARVLLIEAVRDVLRVLWQGLRPDGRPPANEGEQAD